MAQADDKAGAKSARRRARAWAIGASILTHVVALSLLIWSTPALRIPLAQLRPDVTLELNRLIPVSRRTAASAPAAPRPAASPVAVATPTPQARRTPFAPPPTPLPLPTRPAPPTPSAAPAPAAPAPGPAPTARPGPAAPPARGGDQGASGGDERGAVRAAIGCSHENFLQLSPAEREACERKLAEAGRHSGSYVDPIPPLKRGAYDRQAAADARRRDHEGSMDNPITPCSAGSPGSNFGVGCLPPSAMHPIPLGATPRKGAPDPEP